MSNSFWYGYGYISINRNDYNKCKLKVLCNYQNMFLGKTTQIAIPNYSKKKLKILFFCWIA